MTSGLGGFSPRHSVFRRDRTGSED